MTELIDESLRSLGFLYDPLFVVLPERAGQLVVVHGRPVLELAPQRGHPHQVRVVAVFVFRDDKGDRTDRQVSAFSRFSS